MQQIILLDKLVNKYRFCFNGMISASKNIKS